MELSRFHGKRTQDADPCSLLYNSKFEITTATTESFNFQLENQHGNERIQRDFGSMFERQGRGFQTDHNKTMQIKTGTMQIKMQIKMSDVEVISGSYFSQFSQQQISN